MTSNLKGSELPYVDQPDSCMVSPFMEDGNVCSLGGPGSANARVSKTRLIGAILASLCLMLGVEIINTVQKSISSEQLAHFFSNATE